MPSRPAASRWRFTLMAVVIIAAIAFARWKGWLPEEGIQFPPPTGENSRTGGSSQKSLPPKSGPPQRMGAWEQLQGCTLVEDRANDGDSFVVLHNGRQHTIRLYFADSPEKHRHAYNQDRLADQGRYFGGLTEEETVGIGEDARVFSLGLLRAGDFSVLTRWEQVFDSDRHYAFVTVEQGDLAELLVKAGLARIFTKGEDRPAGMKAAAAKQHLQTLERGARRARRGAWGGRMP